MYIDSEVGSLLDKRYRLLSKAYYDLVNEVTPLLESDFSSESITRLDQEYLNLFDLFPTMIKREECPLEWLLAIYVHLETYLVMRGMYSEIVNWGVDIFERFKQVSVTPPAVLLNCMGVGYDALGRLDEAKMVFGLILKHYHDQLNESDNAAIHYNFARLYLNIGEVMKAAVYCKLAVEGDERRGNKRGVALGLALLADVFWETKQYAEGLQVMRRALEVAREIGNAHMIANMTGELARHMYGQCDPHEITKVYEEAIHLLKERHDEMGLARTYHNYAVLCHNNSWHEKAYGLVSLSLEIYERYNPSAVEETQSMLAEWRDEEAAHNPPFC